MKSRLLFSIILGSAMLLNSCEDLLNDKTTAEIAQSIEGSWQCDENSSIFKSTQDIYTVYIIPSTTDSTIVYISNFYSLGNDIEAEARLNGYSITLPTQTLQGGYTVYGTGTISSNLKQISWKYYVDDESGVTDEVDAVYSSQY
jgi:hypothetical protein